MRKSLIFCKFCNENSLHTFQISDKWSFDRKRISFFGGNHGVKMVLFIISNDEYNGMKTNYNVEETMRKYQKYIKKLSNHKGFINTPILVIENKKDKNTSNLYTDIVHIDIIFIN